MVKRAVKRRMQSQTRRRRERSVPDFEELSHLLIENVRDYAIFILDSSGRALTWNAGVKRMRGYEEQEFVSLEFERLFRPAERHAAQQEMQRAELEAKLPAAVAALRQDSAIWVFFRKGSRNAGLDMNRDTVWAIAEKLGLRPLGLVGVDDTWSAFRLRQASDG